MSGVWNAFRRLALGLFLIAMAAAVLLYSDRGRRVKAVSRTARVAIVQHASTPVLDAGVRGVLDGLAESGFRNGDNIALATYNAQGDLATGNAIASQVTSAGYDVVITSSTPSMQAVANANRDGKVVHVFTLVADPFSAGIGLDRDHPLKHPPRMVGYGSFLPVNDAFLLARKALPGLARVGIAWNPAESNSEAFTKKARESCKALGITLLEANVDGSAAISESIRSLASRGAQALFVGGDNTMMSAVGSVIATTKALRIPVFTIMPGTPDRGTLFDVGLDFHELGRVSGVLVARVLRGEDPATIPIRDVQDEVPRQLVVNTRALAGLKEPWRIPDDMRAEATSLVDDTGLHTRAVRSSAPLGKTWKVEFVQYNQVADVEESQEGVMIGFKEAGLVQNRDYQLIVRNAQGDMATVSALVDAAVGDSADLIVTFSTPTLQAAMQRAGKLPVIFTYVASAIAAGAGKSDTDHLPNVTGVYLQAPYDDMIAIIKSVVPSVHSVGTLFVPSETNSVFSRDQLRDATQKAGLQLIDVPANTSSDVPDASLALAARRPDVICQIPGNLTVSAYPTLQAAADRAKLPIFAFQTSQAQGGAMVVLGRDYHESGRLSGLLAARVMRGERPADLPWQSVAKVRIFVNTTTARRLGIQLPQSLMTRVDQVIGQR